MKGTTLKKVLNQGSFWFGGVKFIKLFEVDNELVHCQIEGMQAVVYIAEHAWVENPSSTYQPVGGY
jgi:hypothetical protein